MKDITKLAALALVPLGIAACSSTDISSASARRLAVTMGSAYSAAPIGFSQLSTTFAASAADAVFQPGLGDRGPGGGRGGFCDLGIGPGFGLGLMGGGLLGPFVGGGISRGFFHADSSCTFSASSGQVTCGPTTHDGLTVTRISSYTNAAGAAQSAIDSTTNKVVSAVTVSGTVIRTHRDSASASIIDTSTSTVSEKSNQTVTGLAFNSTARTVNGTSSGTEATTGKTSAGAFTSSRTAGDTVTGVIVPVATTALPRPYPTAGTVIRSMRATVTFTGATPATSTRREVITYDGSATAKVVITVDGTTQNCTMALPNGKLTCS